MAKNAKTPQEKKELSLKKDCRNVFGENDKASRKNIPRSKQRSHMAERRAVQNALAPAALAGAFDVAVADDVELSATTRAIAQQRNSFRKKPDQSLGSILKNKAAGKSK
jgi:hypothetical protein